MASYLGTHSEPGAWGSPGSCQGTRPGVSYTAWQAGVELQEKVSILLSNLSCGWTMWVEVLGCSGDFLLSRLLSFIITSPCPLHTLMPCIDTHLDSIAFSLFLAGWRLSPRQMPRLLSCQLADSVTLLQVG